MAERIQALVELSTRYRFEGDSGPAVIVAAGAVGLAEALLAADDKSAAFALLFEARRELATGYLECGRAASASALAGVALQELEEAAGESKAGVDAVSRGEMMHVHAMARLETGQIRDGIAGLQKAAEVLSAGGGAAVESLVTVELTLAALSAESGDFDAATKLYQSILVRVADQEAKSDQHASFVNAISSKALLGVAGCYAQQHLVHEAKDCLERAVTLMEAAHGHGHPEMSRTLTEVAAIYRFLGDQGAASAVEQELEVAESMLDEARRALDVSE